MLALYGASQIRRDPSYRPTPSMFLSGKSTAAKLVAAFSSINLCQAASTPLFVRRGAVTPESCRLNILQPRLTVTVQVSSQAHVQVPRPQLVGRRSVMCTAKSKESPFSR